ncbi:hypothetical protein VHEMI09058 [[Torrubiella] hemipterigena]|uniref:2EXR domain-containing protein n=1 Tax=[Torrubiella] hemipterigena TaxID=1531966 RepID=A0A0A1TQT4_9HYPO|nr:hypothetical protein VHEMI09058 [[Torrubiella] hemipterigena]
MLPTTFHAFSSLPREIRLAIWKLTVQYEPEVCLCWPMNTSLGYHTDEFRNGYPQLPLTVDTAFPMAMHICQESRAVVQHGDSGIRFRASEAAGCPVPFRLYIPDYDTIYISYESAPLLKLHHKHEDNPSIRPQSDADQQLQDAWCDIIKKAKFIAFEGRFFFFYYVAFNRLLRASRVPGPDGRDVHSGQKQLSFVVASSTYDEHGVEFYDRFKPPGRRCKLVDLSDEALKKVYVYTDSAFENDDNDPVLLPGAIDKTRKEILYWDESDGYTPDDSHLKIIPQIFVEYQPDGTWKEVCQDRIYDFGSGSLTQVSSAPVLFEDRPDPELVRVLDADIPFKPWCIEDAPDWVDRAWP